MCGIRLPAGLRESDRLPEPIFTPATKAEQGQHDQNISFDGMIEHIGGWHGGVTQYTAPLAEAMRERALRPYRYGAAVAERRGVRRARPAALATGGGEGGGPVGAGDRACGLAPACQGVETAASAHPRSTDLEQLRAHVPTGRQQ